MPDFVSSSVRVLEQNPECVATFCAAIEIDENENKTGIRLVPKEIAQERLSILLKEKLLNLVFTYGNFITCPSVVVRSEIYREKICVWNGSTYNTSADLDVWLRLSEFGNVAFINEYLIKYRVAEASYSFRIAKKRTTKHDIFLVLERFRSHLETESYKFLLLKDQAIRSLNLIRTKTHQNGFPNEVRFNLAFVLKQMFKSKWHFKMGVSIIGINLLKLWYS
jgi:hypothetical protein